MAPKHPYMDLNQLDVQLEVDVGLKGVPATLKFDTFFYTENQGQDRQPPPKLLYSVIRNI